jgi:hypothetical protein
LPPGAREEASKDEDEIGDRTRRQWQPRLDELPAEQEEPAAAFHRDRHEHGGAPSRLSEDQLARLTKEERVEAGLEDYDPDEVPPATE